MLINRLGGGIINIIYLLGQFFGLLFKYYLTNKNQKNALKNQTQPPLPTSPRGKVGNEKMKELKN